MSLTAYDIPFERTLSLVLLGLRPAFDILLRVQCSRRVMLQLLSTYKISRQMLHIPIGTLA